MLFSDDGRLSLQTVAALHCGHSGRRLISGQGCPGVPPTDPGVHALSWQPMGNQMKRRDAARALLALLAAPLAGAQ